MENDTTDQPLKHLTPQLLLELVALKASNPVVFKEIQKAGWSLTYTTGEYLRAPSQSDGEHRWDRASDSAHIRLEALMTHHTTTEVRGFWSFHELAEEVKQVFGSKRDE